MFHLRERRMLQLASVCNMHSVAAWLAKVSGRADYKLELQVWL